MRELVNRFAEVRRDLLETVSGFPADRAGEAVCGEWDLRCVLAHIAGWDSYFTEIATLLRAGEDKIPYWGNIEEFNEASVKKREGRAWDEVNGEFVRGGEAFIEEYAGLEKQLWHKRFWEQGDPAPAWVVKINTEHYVEHLEEIKEKLKAWRA